MTKMGGWKMVAVRCLFLVAAISASAQTFTTLVNFNGSNGAKPFQMSLVQGLDGNFYGTTYSGGSSSQCNGGCGTVFKITPEGRLTTLHSFDLTDGSGPFAGLVQATDGNLYGTTYLGGSSPQCNGGCGTVFKITLEGRLTTLYSFDLAGAYPVGLMQASNGDFFGTTAAGGNDFGTIFKITAGGILSTLYSFCPRFGSCTDGSQPSAGLVQGTDGNFYGTTYFGGIYTRSCGEEGLANGCGTVFKITPVGRLTTLYSFCFQTNCTDGYNPSAGLVQGTNGNFYGTTVYGGANDEGTVFKMTARGALTTLHSFIGGYGFYPYAGLVQATDGDFYGTTENGGDNCYCGTVFQITAGGTLTTLVNFDGTDGSNPYGGLVQGTAGGFYGTTYAGGASNDGTVFSLDMGLSPFVTFVRAAGRVGQPAGILGQGLTGTTSVLFNGIPATFTVRRDTFLIATVPAGATTGYVTVTTPSGTLQSNVQFHVLP